jgi:hypothetical protein
MDFSPYQRQSYQKSSHNKNIFILFFVSAAAVFFLLWGIQALFFSEKGFSSPVFYTANSSRAEVKIVGSETWENLGTGQVVTTGDEIKARKGNSGILKLENNSFVMMGLASRVKMGEVKKTEEGALLGEIFLEQGPIFLQLEGAFDPENKLKFWISSHVYIEAKEGKLFFDNSGVAVVDGNGFKIVKNDDSGKMRSEKTIGIGQYLSIEEFALQAMPERIKQIPLFVSVSSGEEPEETPEVIEEDEENLDSPVVTAPLEEDEEGKITVSEHPFSMKGTAPEGTKNITVVFFDEDGETEEYTLKNFSLGDDEWEYKISTHYGNLSEGKNTYQVFGEDMNGKKTKPAVATIYYVPESSDDQVFSSNKGSIAITSPNGGKNGTQESSTIILSGTASKNISYVSIINNTLDTEYTLKQFKKGDTTWKYTSSAMDEKTYKYTVKGLDKNKRTIASDTITLTIKKSSASDSSTPSPSASVSGSPSPSPSPEVIAPTVTPQSATLSVGRE